MLYSALAQEFISIDTKECLFYFDYHNRSKFLDEDKLKNLEKDEYIFIGYEKKTKYPILVDYHNDLYIYDNATYKKTNSFYNLVGIEPNNVPIEFLTMDVFSKSIPLVLILGYLIGFDNLLKILKPKHRIIKSNERSRLEDYEYEIKFMDYKLILDRREIKNSLILSGLVNLDDVNKKVNMELLNDKSIYFTYYKQLGLSSIYIKETDLYNQLFIDPITYTVLEQLNEPLTFVGLLLKSAEMLVLENHPKATDMKYMRIRSYERINGIMYKELVLAVREHKNRAVTSKSQFSLNPYAVSKAIAQDPGVDTLSEINPLMDLKQQSSLTFSGGGGRSKDTLVAKDRVYTESDIGVISEATSDSGDAGVNTYLTANPAIKDVRGLIGEFNFDEVGSTGVLSAGAANSVGVQHEDPKRVNFTTAQNSHTVGCEKYTQAQVRTGYEYIIPQQTKSLFALTAKKNGRVISLNDYGIVVEYDDNTRDSAKLGLRFGDHEGSSFPHRLVTTLKLNDKVKPGEPIAYNTGFFEPDFFDDRYIVCKFSLTSKVALMESQYTLEDSSLITRDLSNEIMVETTHVKSIVINFDQNIHKVVNVGEFIDYNDVLCYIEDSITSNTDIFNESNIETLKALASTSPKSKYKGTLSKIEVFYHGDKDDMSPTLKKLVAKTDKELIDSNKSIGAPVYTGSVNSDYRVGGNPLLLDTAEIRFYITVKHGTDVGDKLVFANQMKSVIGEVINDSIYTEEGEKVYAIFGAKSIAARIVLTPYIIGTTVSILNKIAQNAVELYKP